MGRSRRKKQTETVEPFDFSKITIPEHRSESEIWDSLEKICVSPGYVHALAFLCWRDNFIGYQEGNFKPTDLDKMKSSERLLRSELSLLIGLMVKAPIDFAWPTPQAVQHYIDETEKLMAELHKAMSAVLWANFKETGFDPTKNPFTHGMAMREPFFYASEAAYMFQYRDFSPERYGRDEAWFQEKKGFAPSDVKKIIDAISEIQLEKFQSLREHIKPEEMENFTLLPAFMYSESAIAEASGCSVETTRNVLRAFSPQSLPCNQSFKTVGSFNEVSAYPIIPVGEGNHLLLQNYSLAESAYETPAFWMSKDAAYAETAKKNRGFFTENFSANRLRHILGTDHVHENVYIMKGKNRVGEIDVLALYADRAIILQAKSKKLTEAAKKGDDHAIKTDFQKAIQDAYDQGFKCAELIGDDEYRLTDEQGNSLTLRRNFAEIFVFCVVSEYYPSLARQADQFLKRREHDVIRPPYVMDVFFLDVLCEILDTPLQFFNFLHRRVGSERVKSESELAVLSYHLAYNLWFEEGYDFIDLGEDFSVHLDAAILARREGLPGERTPKGILTKLQGTFFDRLIQQISRLETDNVLELGYFLLEISEDGANQLAQSCETIMTQARLDRRAHDATMGFAKSGITIHSNYLDKKEAGQRLFAHCSAAKYRQKAETWFGVALNPETGDIDFALGLKSPWEQSNDMDHVISQYFPAAPYKNMKQALKHYQSQSKRKVGRNEPCPCGSGKKHKKCCLR
ncbi:SEC-C metal-binding domain-containing protein [Micavibrio aeruginosavorus]|uniref:SEC-C motif family protein n=1 Tax=Micavibrio aeruginosavorus (strain ARL-13) TaxID=856793 RepID=G2KQZ7_MICAA|nr:SEC-C metal-binding domain-containing protein [Micavibrio aeruginosavorus]AEP10475.1 SEC-C motif family protein [Micavibrio aeruginosavorus ARL-13]